MLQEKDHVSKLADHFHPHTYPVPVKINYYMLLLYNDIIILSQKI